MGRVKKNCSASSGCSTPGMVKAHTRRCKSGKVTAVKAHPSGKNPANKASVHALQGMGDKAYKDMAKQNPQLVKDTEGFLKVWDANPHLNAREANELYEKQKSNKKSGYEDGYSDAFNKSKRGRFVRRPLKKE